MNFIPKLPLPSGERGGVRGWGIGKNRREQRVKTHSGKRKK
jgi:hypothetical protein